MGHNGTKTHCHTITFRELSEKVLRPNRSSRSESYGVPYGINYNIAFPGTHPSSYDYFVVLSAKINNLTTSIEKQIEL